MKRGLLSVVLAVFVMGGSLSARAQAAVYGEFSSVILTNLTERQVGYGVTTGVLIDGPNLGEHVLLSADIQGRFIGKSGLRMDGVTVGPRFALRGRKFGVTPFAEFLVGFARGYDRFAPSSTDNTIQVNGGVTKYITPRLDAVLDYSYSQFYFNGGEYNPKAISLGAVYHFSKR